MNRGKTLVCVAKLHKNQLERHLELFEHLSDVERVIVVRHEAVSDRLSKVENRTFGGRNRPHQALLLAREVRRVVTECNADWVWGFNPVPWGSIGSWATTGLSCRIGLSLIGMDFLQLERWWGRPFLQTLKRADAITVTGHRMQEGLATWGIPRKKSFILPHSVDTQRFAPHEQRGRWDVVSVGQLISRKRMDVLIEATGRAAQTLPELRVGILGKGPLLGELQSQVARLGLERNVEFLGYRDDVEAVLAGARVFCLASEWEGVPFALMEAMACGLVPVVTDVGTIGDWVTDGVNGRIVDVGDAEALGKAIVELLGPREAWRALRPAVLTFRENLGFEAGAAVWKRILSGSGPQ